MSFSVAGKAGRPETRPPWCIYARLGRRASVTAGYAATKVAVVRRVLSLLLMAKPTAEDVRGHGTMVWLEPLGSRSRNPGEASGEQLTAEHQLIQVGQGGTPGGGLRPELVAPPVALRSVSTIWALPTPKKELSVGGTGVGFRDS